MACQDTQSPEPKKLRPRNAAKAPARAFSAAYQGKVRFVQCTRNLSPRVCSQGFSSSRVRRERLEWTQCFVRSLAHRRGSNDSVAPSAMQKRCALERAPIESSHSDFSKPAFGRIRV